ncbi:hypothetical protein MLD38_040899 [Melastoma candidum]|nr:hypothetical protein MLD38_040899 [Melastoma candidum]
MLELLLFYFLFVVMMLNLQLTELSAVVTNLLPQAELGILNWFNSVFLGVESAQYSPISDVHYAFNTTAADTQFASFLQIQSIGYSIYTTGALWLIVASVILLLAMVGPITLSMNKTPNLPPFTNN